MINKTVFQDPGGIIVPITDHTSYSWDEENRLTGTFVGADGQNTSVVYEYDALGRRVKRTVDLDETKYTYDGMDVVRDEDRGSLVTYQNAPGVDNKLKFDTGNGPNYFLQDHLGSTLAITKTSGGIVDSTNYDSFGNASNPSFATRYQFTGRERDDFTGLMYYRARWYDPKIGRFISEDPIGFAGGDINLYGYVWNNPVKFVDPLGTDGGASAAISAGTLVTGGGQLGAFLAALAPPLAVAAVGAVAIAGAYELGAYTANHPSNPYVNGRLNPFRAWDKFWEPVPYPAPPAIPVTASGPGCQQPMPRAIPWSSTPSFPIPLGPYPPITPEKQTECFNQCQYLLGIGDNGEKFKACYRRCLGTIS